MTPPLERGDLVQVTTAGCSVLAQVILASRNGRSVMLRFEGLFARFVECLPAFEVAEGWRAITGVPLVITRTESMVERARELVAAGYAHDCDEWTSSATHACAVCGRREE